MRAAKLLLAVGLVLAVAGTAGATSFAGLNWLVVPSPGNTILEFDIKDWSMATSYAVASGSTYNGFGTVNGLASTGAPLGAMTITKGQTGPGGIGNVLVDAGEIEDGWSIVQVNEIRDSSTDIVLWSSVADDDHEIWGLVYGEVDNFVRQLDDQTTGSIGLFADFYIQPEGTFDSFGGIGQGSAGRLAFDQYLGIGYEGLNDPIDPAILMVECEGTDGHEDEHTSFTGPDGILGTGDDYLTDDPDGDGVADAQRWALFSPSPTSVISGTGTGAEFYDIVGGAWQADYGDPGPMGINLEQKEFFFPTVIAVHGDSRYGDLHSGQRIEPYIPDAGAPVTEDWVIESFDPVEGAADVIPEPITMLGALIGIGSVGGYIRRRRNA